MKSHVEKGDCCVQTMNTPPHAPPPWGRNLGRKRVFVGPPKEKMASKGCTSTFSWLWFLEQCCRARGISLLKGSRGRWPWRALTLCHVHQATSTCCPPSLRWSCGTWGSRLVWAWPWLSASFLTSSRSWPSTSTASMSMGPGESLFLSGLCLEAPQAVVKHSVLVYFSWIHSLTHN